MELNLSIKCRGCLAEEPEMHNIFHMLSDDLTLANILSDTTSIQIEENEEISPYLCIKCTETVINFYNFKVEFAKSREYFQNLSKIKEEFLNADSNSGVFPEHIILVDDSVNLEEINKELQRIKCENPVENENQNAFVPPVAPLRIHTIVGKSAKKMHVSDNTITETHKQVMQPEVGVFTVQNELVQIIESVAFFCKSCNKEYLSRDEFLEHMNLVHGKVQVVASKFTRRTWVKVPLGQIKEEHDDVDFEDTIDNKKHEKILCKVCKIHVPRTKYEGHYDKHKVFVCTCGAKFVKKTNLVTHEMGVHSDKRPFACKYCDKTFKTQYDLNSHLKHHTHPRLEICHICGQRFDTKTVMNTHINLKHFPTRNFQCNFCGLKFPLKGTLMKHIRRRHTDRERAFSCSMCNMSYYEKGALNRHIASKHSDETVESKCEYCGKSFTTKGNLYKHVRRVHKNVTM